MKRHIKVIANIFLTSIALSILLGSFLRILGPLNQIHRINKGINITGKSRRSIKKELLTKKSNLLSFYNDKLEKFEKLEKLINKWENHIIKNPGLEVSAFSYR